MQAKSRKGHSGGGADASISTLPHSGSGRSFSLLAPGGQRMAASGCKWLPRARSAPCPRTRKPGGAAAHLPPRPSPFKGAATALPRWADQPLPPLALLKRAGSVPTDPRRLHRPPRPSHPAPAAASRSAAMPAAAPQPQAEQGTQAAAGSQLFPTLAEVVRREQQQLAEEQAAAATADDGPPEQQAAAAPPLPPLHLHAQPPLQQGEARCRPHPSDPTGVVFEWRLRGVEAAAEPLESPPFQVGEAQWRLVLHPRGLNGRGRQLSLYLSAAEWLAQDGGSPFGAPQAQAGRPWSQRLLFTLSLRGPRGSSLSRSEAHTFDAAEPTYGFTSFAPRNQVLGPAASLLRADGSLLLRATCVPAVPTPRG